MLKYNIKLNEPKGYDELKCEELYFSRDLSFISGITDYNYDLYNKQKIMIEFNNNSIFNEVVIDVKNVIRQGYTEYDQIFDIEEYKNYKGFYYIDGKYYFTNKNSDIINIKGIDYKISDNNTILVKTKYYVEDNKIKIGDFIYNVDINLFRTKDNDGNYHYVTNENPKIKLKNGDIIDINIYERNDWEIITKFIARKSDDYSINVNYVSFTDKIYYFVPFKDNKKFYFTDYKIIEEKLIHYCVIDNKEYYIDNGVVKCEDKVYQLEFEWANTSYGRFINIFTDNNNLSFKPQQKILVESPSIESTRIESKIDNKGNEYFNYLGVNYYTEKNKKIYYIPINDKYYEFFETKDKWGMDEVDSEYTHYGYVYLSDDLSPIPVAITNDNSYVIYSYYKEKEASKSKIKAYDYVLINNDKFIIKLDTISKVINDKEVRYIEINRTRPFNIIIDDVISNSMLRCHVDNESNDSYSEINNYIINNFKNLKFSLINELFAETNVTKDGFINEYLIGNVIDKVSFFNFSSKIEIPILTCNDSANNLLQEDILENIFTKNEIDNCINPIVDMEREIYYPSYKKEDNNFSLVNELIFNLHFRTRDMNNWKINENYSNDKHSWNIFDYYNKLKEEFKYQQPSDLLYFLKFTDDDIFYQKSKVGKSFLRLSFFNSNNPANQTLLYTCTVFIDEGKLYKKYIDGISNRNNKFNDYINVLGLKDINGDTIRKNTIGVSYETCDEKGDMTFNDEKRLSASISVKNRYECDESSEGFYLYIFKEYCERLHEEPIYMKIDFNHAGEGRTINFTVPFRIDEKNEYHLLDLTNDNDIEFLKEGISLNELYKYIFIPLESVYDFNNKRYCYYMPSWLKSCCDSSVMKFNLYEIKIKDESNNKDSTQ